MSLRAHPVRYTLLPALVLACAVGWVFHKYIGGALLVGWWIGINLVTYPVWWIDKRQARREGFRVPEWTLHLLALLGGGLAGVLAMQSLRHKTQKAIFRIGQPLLLLLSAVAMGWWLNR